MKLTPHDSESIPPQFKVDIRNAPIQEEDSGEAESAIANVANTLRMVCDSAIYIVAGFLTVDLASGANKTIQYY